MDGTVTTTEDPYTLFQDWMAEATKGEINDPNAVCLATATPFSSTMRADGRPSGVAVARHTAFGSLISPLVASAIQS